MVVVVVMFSLEKCCKHYMMGTGKTKKLTHEMTDGWGQQWSSTVCQGGSEIADMGRSALCSSSLRLIESARWGALCHTPVTHII